MKLISKRLVDLRVVLTKKCWCFRYRAVLPVASRVRDCTNCSCFRKRLRPVQVGPGVVGVHTCTYTISILTEIKDQRSYLFGCLCILHVSSCVRCLRRRRGRNDECTSAPWCDSSSKTRPITWSWPGSVSVLRNDVSLHVNACGIPCCVRPRVYIASILPYTRFSA